jgi:hypothetical protein
MTATEFRPDQDAYLRAHSWMAAFAMGAAMTLLWVTGNPHVWTGGIGGFAAIALRGLYMRSEEMAVVWTLTDTELTGPAGRSIPLAGIAKVNRMGSYVQVITEGGDKHLIKYQADPKAVEAAILEAAG